MSGPSFDLSAVSALLTDTGVGVVAQTYNREALIFPLIADVVGVNDVTHPLMGDKRTILVGSATPKRRLDGHPVEASTMGAGPTIQGSVKLFARKVSIPERQIQAAGSNPKAYVRPAEEWMAQFTRDAMAWKDRSFAQALALGAWAAGRKDIYEHGWPGHADPYPGLGYDGLCWYAEAHTLTQASTTYDNHYAATALTQTALDLARVRMQVTNAVDEAGARISIRAKNLIVGGTIETLARTTLESKGTTGNANNDINPVAGKFNIIVNPFLDEFDSDGWLVTADQSPFRVMDSGPPEFRHSYNEDTKCVDISGEVGFGFYLTDFRGVVAANYAVS